MQTRKRRKAEDSICKKTCMSPSMFKTPISDLKEQHIRGPSHFEQWDINEVALFLTSEGFDEYTSIFKGTVKKVLSIGVLRNKGFLKL